MANKLKVTIASDGVAGFFRRTKEEAKRLDRGKAIDSHFTINFENAEEMVRCLSTERIRLMRELKRCRTTPISALATRLKRDRRAVDRDVVLLEEAGLIRTRYEVNPGHGRLKVVEPVAEEYRVMASF